MNPHLYTLLVATLLLTLGKSSALRPDAGPHFLATRRVLLFGPASAPAPFQSGAVLPNSDPACNPQWAYTRRGVTATTSVAMAGMFAPARTGTDALTGATQESLSARATRLQSCPQLRLPRPLRQVLVSPVSRAPARLLSMRLTLWPSALHWGGTVLAISATRYSCTCCTGTAIISMPSPPNKGRPPPPPYVSPPDPGAAIKKRVGIIIGCTWGGILLIFGICVYCFCCVCKKRAPGRATRRNDVEQPPLIGRPKSASESEHSGGSEESGAKKWFEPGYSGPDFKTTGAGVVFSKSLPKNERFVELFATAYDQNGRGPGSRNGAGKEENGTGRGQGESTPVGGRDTYSDGTMNSDSKAKGKESEVSEVRASIEGLPEDEICIVCCNAPKECVFVPCGHHATCLACGRLVQQQGQQGCPVCRRPIERVLKIYEA